MKLLQLVDASQAELLHKYPWAVSLIGVVLIAGYVIRYQAKEIKSLRAEHQKDVKELDKEVKDMSKDNVKTLAELGQYLRTKIGQDEKVTELLHKLNNKIGK